MKKVFLVVTTVFACIVSAHAQSEKAKLVFGVKAGINVSNIKQDPNDDDIVSIVGVAGGLYATVQFNDAFSIQPELIYSSLGAKDKFINETSVLKYAALPLLIKYNFQNTPLSAYVGPQIGFLMSAKLKYDGGTDNIKDEVNSTDFSGILGLEYLLSKGLNISARYQLGLSDIDKSALYTSKNYVFSFTVGFNLGKK